MEKLCMQGELFYLIHSNISKTKGNRENFLDKMRENRKGDI